MNNYRDEDGKYQNRVNDDEIIHFFETDQRDFYSAQEIANKFDFDRSQAYRRLSQLDEDGEIERIKVGKRNIVWWRPRDIAIFIEEGTGYSIIDSKTGITTQGETKPEALRKLAEAIEVHEGKTELTPEEIYEELGIDTETAPENKMPPWDNKS